MILLYSFFLADDQMTSLYKIESHDLMSIVQAAKVLLEQVSERARYNAREIEALQLAVLHVLREGQRRRPSRAVAMVRAILAVESISSGDALQIIPVIVESEIMVKALSTGFSCASEIKSVEGIHILQDVVQAFNLVAHCLCEITTAARCALSRNEETIEILRTVLIAANNV